MFEGAFAKFLYHTCMSSPHVADIPPEFLRLWDFAHEVVAPNRELGSAALHVLPPSIRRAAEIVEESEPYRQFVKAISRDGRPGPWRLHDFVRRAGFYQALDHSAQQTAVWHILQSQLKNHVAAIDTLVLLDGCWFPNEQFAIAGVSIRRFSDEGLRELGPSPAVASVFFPLETLDQSWFTRVWFLCRQEDREIKPSGIYVRFGYDVLRTFWEPILGLALYKTDYFGLPIVLESDRAWRLDRVRWADPMSNPVESQSGGIVEVPRTDYDVGVDEKTRFDAFRGFFDHAIAVVREIKEFRLAARRYLRAVQIAGPHVFNEDDYEDALLQHSFALEALLSGGEREALGDKLATRAAWLIGTSDRVRNEVFRAVKSLYGARSTVVHGGAAERNRQMTQALEEVRDLLRRVLLALMALRRTTSSNDECLRLLKTAAIDRSSQAAVAEATQSVWSLIDPGFERPQSVWGVEYDQAPFTG